MTLTVPCLFGLESLVADEMKRLGLKDVRAENGRVHCTGTELDIARLNLNLRCGARVLMELASFPPGTSSPCFRVWPPCLGRTTSPGRVSSPSRAIPSIPSSIPSPPVRPS